MTYKLLRINTILCMLAVILFSSCQENNKSADTSKTEKKTKKGRIWDKVNVYQIPLTAEEYPLKGKVKTATYQYYTLTEKNGQVEKKFSGRDSNVYDEAGHLIDQTSWDENGKRLYKCTYAYDKDNKATLWHFITDRDSSEANVTFKYDDKGNTIEQLWADSDPTQSMKTTYKYDDNGNVLEETRYDGDGKIRTVTSSKYDAKGNQTEFVYKDKDGKIRMKQTAAYDGNGYKISGDDYNNDSLVGKWTRKNDADGHMLEETSLSLEGKVLGGRRSTYDKMGNEIKGYVSKEGNPAEHILTDSTTYEYDKTGNAIKETMYYLKPDKTGKTTYTEAVYTYYE